VRSTLAAPTAEHDKPLTGSRWPGFDDWTRWERATRHKSARSSGIKNNLDGSENCQNC